MVFVVAAELIRLQTMPATIEVAISHSEVVNGHFVFDYSAADVSGWHVWMVMETAQLFHERTAKRKSLASQ